MLNGTDSKIGEFKCQQCGDCCRWGGYVYITEDDVKRISRHLSLSEFEFVNEFAEIITRPRLNLKTKDDGRCIFQERNDCIIHAVKPKQCAGFPDSWRIRDLESFCDGQRKISRDTKRP